MASCFSQAFLLSTALSGSLVAQAVKYNPVTRTIWNNKVLISWQNVTHVYQKNSRNLVVDTLKFDDDGNNDPTNDQNRILPHKRPGLASGFLLDVDSKSGHGGGSPAGVVTKNANGSYSLVLRQPSAATGNSSATLKYTVSPGTAAIKFDLSVRVGGKPGQFFFGLYQISSVWVTRNPGQVALYDRASVSNPRSVSRASLTPSCNPLRPGVDFQRLLGQTRGYVGLASSKNRWTLGMAITCVSSPVDLEWNMYMNSRKFCGWPFARLAYARASGLAANSTFTMRGFVWADKSGAFQGLANLLQPRWSTLGPGCACRNNIVPKLCGNGGRVGQTLQLNISSAPPLTPALFFVGLTGLNQTRVACGNLFVLPVLASVVFTQRNGNAQYNLPIPPIKALRGLRLYTQGLIVDPLRICLSNGLRVALL